MRSCWRWSATADSAALECQLGDNAAAVPRQTRGRSRQRPDDSAPPTHSARTRHPVLPDILANSGGVCVSYFEWVQKQ